MGELFGPGGASSSYLIGVRHQVVVLQLSLTEDMSQTWELRPDGARELGEALIDGVDRAWPALASDLDAADGGSVSSFVECRPDSVDGGTVAFSLGVNDIVEISWEVVSASALKLGNDLIAAASQAEGP